MQADHCTRTCRSLFPNEPETWCSGCTRDESEDREANMRRWRESEARRIPNNHWIDQHGAIHLMPKVSK